MKRLLSGLYELERGAQIVGRQKTLMVFRSTVECDAGSPGRAGPPTPVQIHGMVRNVAAIAVGSQGYIPRTMGARIFPNI